MRREGQLLSFGTASRVEDLNWIRVRMTVVDDTAHWSSTDPVLETPDLESLPTWLRALPGRSQGEVLRWDTREANLALECAREGQTFKVTAELWQEWRRPGTDLEEEPIKVRLLVDEKEFESFADALDLYGRELPWRSPTTE